MIGLDGTSASDAVAQGKGWGDDQGVILKNPAAAKILIEWILGSLDAAATGRSQHPEIKPLFSHVGRGYISRRPLG